LVPLFTPIVIYLLLLAMLALVSAVETAIHMARDLERRSEGVSGGVAEQLRSIAANPFLYLHRALLLSATLNLALATLGVYLVSGPLRELGWNPWAAASLLFLSTVLVGDVLPKSLAARAPSAVLQGSLRLRAPLRPLLDPLAAWSDRTTEALLQRLVSRRVQTQPPVTRNEFETLIEMREEQGQLEAAEADMLREALDIESLTVRDCMVPRVDLTLVSAADKPERIEVALEQPAGRYVIIYGETPDMVEGVVDSLAWKLAGRPQWRTLRMEVPFVPETMPVLDGLDGPLRAGPALIVDEYGGLEGLISQEEIADWLLHEAAPWLGEASEIRDLGGGRYILDGGTRIDDVNRQLGTEIDPGGLDTIGGLVFNQLAHVPKAGERLSLEGVELKVRRVVRARVLEVELRLPLQAGKEGVR
jgi:putative hemolysin